MYMQFKTFIMFKIYFSIITLNYGKSDITSKTENVLF